MSLRKQAAGIWPLALWSVAATVLLLCAASSTGFGSVHRRVLLSKPLALGDPTGLAVLNQLVEGRVGGVTARLPATNSTAFKRAFERCRAPEPGVPPLPKLKRAAAWEGSNTTAAIGNATAIATLHMDRLPLLLSHCAVWPHTVMAVVYAPVSTSRHYICLDEVATSDQLRRANSWLSALGLGGGGCQYSGWSLPRLRARVREVQKQAQAAGMCNLRVELWTEEITAQLGSGAGLMPQAALQNKALLALQQPEGEVDEEHTVVFLGSDMAAVDVRQLLSTNTRWQRASEAMRKGAALVLPAFQLTPYGSVREGMSGEAGQLRGKSLDSAVKSAMAVVTAEAGKFPLLRKYLEGKARIYKDHGFSSSQTAALPELWFEAGDMHGDEDNGYPVIPQPGFAPFIMMRQRHVPWADERLRGSYYHRAWQALVTRYMGMQHVVQPNAFMMQLPHADAYSMAEASLINFLAMEPVFRQLVEEMSVGQYVPVTSFGDSCPLNLPTAEIY